MDPIRGLFTDIASFLPFGYAFGAGMVSTVNPCGFLMLPAFVSYYLGAEEPSRLSPVGRGLRGLVLGLLASAGFVAIFSAIGLIISLGGRGLIRSFPWLGLFIGAALILLGLFILFTGRSFGLSAAHRIRVPLGTSPRAVFLFGVAYGLASLSCTLPVFLVVVGGALASGGLLHSFLQFVSYGLGMGVVLMAVTVGAAFFKGAVATYLSRLLPYVQRIGGLFLVAAGAYLLYYWLRYFFLA